MDKHAKQVAQHVSKLSAKEYWVQFESAPHFVVLFIPNDSFLAAAAEKDPELIASALSKQVVIATPTTFIALLRAIAVGWQQHVAVENAGRIRNLGQDLQSRSDGSSMWRSRTQAASETWVKTYRIGSRRSWTTSAKLEPVSVRL